MSRNSDFLWSQEGRMSRHSPRLRRTSRCSVPAQKSHCLRFAHHCRRIIEMLDDVPWIVLTHPPSTTTNHLVAHLTIPRTTLNCIIGGSILSRQSDRHSAGQGCRPEIGEPGRARMCRLCSGRSPTAGATCSRTVSPITPSRSCAASMCSAR